MPTPLDRPTSSPAPVQFSGVIPSLAQIGDLGPPRSELGIGALMPWAGKLYVCSYNSHRASTGHGVGLRVIDADFQLSEPVERVDGTYANRFIHAPSNQLIIGPHIIDAEHRIRTVPQLVDVRCTGTAAHLSRPERLVYVLGMEGELFELDVVDLGCRQVADLTQALGTPGEFRCHFKDCYSSGGKLYVVNNDYGPEDFAGEQAEGTLAEFDGERWRVIERKPFVCVHGRGGFGGGNVFATGWDRASAILQVFTPADGAWRRYRLPKASHTHDHKWQTEWPRIREVEHERFLVDLHGMWYELSPWCYGERCWGLRPISSHLWVHGDFCSWRGLLVVGADNASPSGGHNCLTAEPQSGLWFGRTDDLWKQGPRAGWGGPWWDDAVTAGEPSDPYLMTGFSAGCLHLSHQTDAAVRFRIELDAKGCGDFRTWRTVEVDTGELEVITFTPGLSAHWLRVVAERDCVASAQVHYPG